MRTRKVTKLKEMENKISKKNVLFSRELTKYVGNAYVCVYNSNCNINI